MPQADFSERELWPSRDTQFQSHASPYGAFVQISKRCPPQVDAAYARHIWLREWREGRISYSTCPLDWIPWYQDQTAPVQQWPCLTTQRAKQSLGLQILDLQRKLAAEFCSQAVHLKSWRESGAQCYLLLSLHS
jgi:hypothetical protein